MTDQKSMRELKFVEKKYSWEDMSLWQYLEEGHIPTAWKDFFLNNQKVLYDISEAISKENNKKIYPPIHKVFRAFIPTRKIKVVILGQDPYHNGSAVGYCFSVLPGNSVNPSLRNIYKELKREGFELKEDGVITHWADQGCFLINTALTVKKGCADSHTSFWYDFTENAVKYVADHCENVAWLLMGRKAQKFKQFIPESHLAICTSHPSPFSAHKGYRDVPAFIGSDAFSSINSYLEGKGETSIEW